MQAIGSVMPMARCKASFFAFALACDQGADVPFHVASMPTSSAYCRFSNPCRNSEKLGTYGFFRFNIPFPTASVTKYFGSFGVLCDVVPAIVGII